MSKTNSITPLYVKAATHQLLLAIGRSDEEGTKETPLRVSKFYAEWLTVGEPNFNFTDFDAGSFDQMILQRGIPFYSLCEHHLLPFFGTAVVAYIPNGRIIGLSKLARVVDWYSRRPQNQERLTHEVASCLSNVLKPKGVAVLITGRHLCMEMRGVKMTGAETVTSYVDGVFREDQKVREEFFNIAKGA